MTELTQSIAFASFGGILPAIIWLTFWLQEDKLHPEPRKLIILTFFYGMLSVIVALVLQYLIGKSIGEVDIFALVQNSFGLGLSLLIIWAAIEEYVKYSAAKHGGLLNKANDEAVDPMIYMITAALGFAAFENILFIIVPLLDGDIASAFTTGNMRFVGATLLHVVASSMIGASLSFSFLKLRFIQRRHFLIGFILSVTLHTLFNLFIIKNDNNLFPVFAATWIVMVVILALFEKVKKIHIEKITYSKKYKK